MNVGSVGYSQTYTPQTMRNNANAQQVAAKDVEGTKQSYADAAKKAEHAQEGKATTKAEGEKDVTSHVESFTYGALGMAHPEDVKESDDTAYSAGQFLSALGTVGALLAIVV